MASLSEPADNSITDEELAGMIAIADLPSLLAALAHISRQPALPGEDLGLDPTKHHEPQGGWTPDQQGPIRGGSHQTAVTN
jgi:hypothetical protein